MRAVVNPTWIHVSVGLGHWPAKINGLLANADGNVNKIAARDGTVLTNPFSFEDLYHRYSDSWRVASNESLLSVCGDRNVERGIPRRPFYAKISIRRCPNDASGLHGRGRQSGTAPRRLHTRRCGDW